MGRRKSGLILGCLLLITVASGWCIEESASSSGFPSEVDDKLEKLQIYFETEMYKEAAALLDELIAQFPAESKFKYLKAVVDYQNKDYSRASLVFAEFIQAYPEVAEPYYLLGEINLKTGDRQRAKQYLARYCELAPEDIEAQRKLDALSGNSAGENSIMLIQDGRALTQTVQDIGFYGACVPCQQEQAIELFNGSFRTWSSMGIDFVYPLDLRGKTIVINLKGKSGGEKLALTLRDKFAQDYNPQLMLAPEEKAASDWREIKVTLDEASREVDLSCITHLGLEFGFSTVRNPANSAIFIKDIVIKNARN